MRIRYILPIILAITPLVLWGQEDATDTIAAQELHEIVIEAPKVIRKADMDTYYPSQSAVDNSKKRRSVAV